MPNFETLATEGPASKLYKQVNTIVTAIYEDTNIDGDYKNAVVETEYYEDALVLRNTIVPDIPVKNAVVDIVQSYNDVGDIEQYSYVVKQNNKLRYRYENADATHSEHRHHHDNAGVEEEKKRRDYQRPSISELFHTASTLK